MPRGMHGDPFEDFSEFSEDDFKILDAATQFMGLSSGNQSITTNINCEQVELQKLREELALMKRKTDQLEKTVLQVQQERITKEGEASILRERLKQVENERCMSLAKVQERLIASEQSRQALESDLRRSTDAMKAELQLKNQELESLSSMLGSMKIQSRQSQAAPIKERRITPPDVPEGFEVLATAGRKRPIEPELVATPRPIEQKASAIPVEKSEREVLDTAFFCLESTFDLKTLVEYDRKAVLQRKHDLYQSLRETGCLLFSLELLYDQVLARMRQSLFIFFVELITTVFMVSPDLAYDAYSRKPYQSGSSECALVSKMCAFLSKPPFGLHPRLLKSHLGAFKCFLSHAKNAIPLEIKDLFDGQAVLARCLSNQLDDEGLLIDYLHLMALMSCDRSAVTLFLRQCPPPVDASLLALLVKVGIEKMSRSALDKPNLYAQTLTEFLLFLAQKNLLPTHVAFDKRFLRELVRSTATQFYCEKIDPKTPSQYMVTLRSLHHVFVEKAQDLRSTIQGLYFSLHFMAETLLRGSPPAQVMELARPLAKLSACEIEKWIAKRDASRYDFKIKIPINV